MAFERKIIQLNILADDGNTYTPGFAIPDGNSKITAQFFSSGLDGDASLTLQQSVDGTNYDPVLDVNGTAITLILDKDNASSTINLINLLTNSIRFSIDFATSQADPVPGSISSVQYLTS